MVKRIFMVAGLALWLSLVLSPVSTQAQSGRQVWAYFFGWWLGDSWGNPALSDYPLSPYDQRDGGVLANQIGQAQSAGIDAFIMSYFGPKDGNLTHQVFNMLLDIAAGSGFKVGASIDMHEAGYNSNLGELSDSINYVVNDRANHPAYLRYNGKPVIFFWNQTRYSVGDWQNLRAALDPNRNTIWVAEGTNTAYLSAFDGLYLFNTAWAGNPGATARQWQSRVQNNGGTFYAPTVLPGWDETAIAAATGRRNPTSPRARNDGQFLTNSWNGAVSANTDVILVVSWNEYFENSHIEPSQKYGTQSLDVIRGLIAAWKSGAPAGGGQSASAPPVSASGVIYVLNAEVNFRDTPNGNKLGTIPAGTQLEVTGRNADGSWAQVNYNGANGWVTASFGSFNGDFMSVAVR